MSEKRRRQQGSLQATQCSSEQLPQLPSDVWAIIARKALEAEWNDAHACSRFSLVSKAWFAGVEGVEPAVYAYISVSFQTSTLTDLPNKSECSVTVLMKASHDTEFPFSG
jgi:hypothetical protein